MTEERKRILPLDKNVVNLIAAGEIIIAPSNALKELLENSIDASATQIEIIIKDGGMKLLQITDNGKGIYKEDLPILCERFTTSKLIEFNDLQNISTYGFRGEALASISHVSQLNIITKTDNDQCAWKSTYKNGDLIGGIENGIKPVAGKTGTIISVEDLFYNVPSRLRALKNSNEEYSSILDVVSKYSIHVENVGFNCQRQGKSLDIMIRKNSNRKDRIRSIYGSNIANNLISVNIEIEENFIKDFGLIKCTGMISNTSFENKKLIQPIFFINHRLIICDPLRRAINSLYSTYLPKGHKPFVYLSLEIKPQNVDVNVHPTKREVRFLNEDEIIDKIIISIDKLLSELDSSRKFLTQQILTNTRKIEDDVEERRNKRSKLTLTEPIIKEKSKILPLSHFKKPYEHEMVRTDYNQTTLNNFVSQKSTQRSNTSSSSIIQDSQTKIDNILESSEPSLNNEFEIDSSTILETTIVKKVKKPMTLLSIRSLRQELQEHGNRELTQLFSQHTYVGIVDYEKRLCCIQHDVRLYLVDYASLCADLFYHIGLADFSSFGKIEIINENGIDIKNLIKIEIYENKEFVENYCKQNNVKELPNLNESLQTCFVDMYEMWEEYFSIEIDITDQFNPKLKSLPLLVKRYIPSWNKLSLFLFRVISKVNWNDEKECLGGILRQLALFYVPECIYDDVDNVEDRQKQIADCLENLLMPIVKRKFLATDNLIRDVIEIASLPRLYRVFERC
ncbi:DNA mismatch repair protein [Pichia californica]|uniref:DNA mismatch repair protein n=1 Tax=Pichia californica TaxID=460514 RepID=A0A9P6WPR2_9ASCO|nr:DNA mismatch repair protein [[Candida] californica]KAG0690944.1 DNA mismatch repair protein [[Candida] californica]